MSDTDMIERSGSGVKGHVAGGLSSGSTYQASADHPKHGGGALVSCFRPATVLVAQSLARGCRAVRGPSACGLGGVMAKTLL